LRNESRNASQPGALTTTKASAEKKTIVLAAATVSERHETG
jgi:hypothetical protein